MQMGKYLLKWQLDPTRAPVDPKERARQWTGLLAMVKKDLEKKLITEWGVFAGEDSGYMIAQGSETEISVMVQQYYPFVHFETHPIMSIGQAEEVVKTMQG
jgi:hypothetical protein